jgi:hypothetical protein
VNIDERLRVVKLNEIECETHADRARASWKTLKSTAKDAATPWRIVTVGAVAGFLMGRSAGGTASGGSSVGAKLFGTVAEMLITTLGAAGTAGAASAAAADAAASATSDAVAEGAATPEGRVAAAAAMHDETTAEHESDSEHEKV